jgi:hypothetical protein
MSNNVLGNYGKVDAPPYCNLLQVEISKLNAQYHRVVRIVHDMAVPFGPTLLGLSEGEFSAIAEAPPERLGMIARYGVPLVSATIKEEKLYRELGQQGADVRFMNAVNRTLVKGVSI